MKKRFSSGSVRLLALAVIAAGVLSLGCSVQAAEIRAFWIDAWAAGFWTQSQVDSLLGIPGNGSSIGEIRDANCNTVVIQVRRRADVCYPSGMGEPYMSGLSPSNFNALQAIINAAHDTTGGKARLNVVAWFVIFPTGTGTVYQAHDDPADATNYWMTRSNTGAEDDGSGDGYQFDPGHPKAEEYMVDVAMDVVNNFDVDGIQFDRVRYTGPTWGYNPTSVSRFHAVYGGSGNPTYTDANWCQWRRDQITNFVRKAYAKAVAVNPDIEVSAAVVTWAAGPTTSTRAAFQAANPYNGVFQDWDAWNQEGILDTCYTMNYFDQAGAYAAHYVNWMNFQKDRKFNRRTVVGPGLYLNSLSNAILQLQMTRNPSPAGNYAEGFSGYCYRLAYYGGTWAGLKPSLKTSVTPTWDSAPTMSWKTSPTKGHIMGDVTLNSAWLDGASVTLTGPENRTITCDGTGFYAFIDLTPGSYTVSVTYAGQTEYEYPDVTAGTVQTADINFIGDTIVDDLDSGASWTGTWSTNTIAGGWPTTASEYKYTTTVTTATHTFTWRPNIPQTGNYDVYVWYLAGSNRTTAAPFTVVYNGGSQNVNVNQTINGSQWYKIASNKSFSAGTAGYVRVANNASVTGKVVIADAVKFVLLAQTGPTITGQPSAQSICSGGTATFSVTATGSGTLTYQWQKNSTNLSNGGHYSGVTTSTLTVSSADSSDVANYRCVVTDSNGSANSNDAALSLKAATTITTQPSNVSVCSGSTTSFTVAATGDGTLAYQWRKGTSNITNGGHYSGATTATLTITGADSSDVVTNYNCVVTGGCGSATSNNATLSLKTATAITAHPINATVNAGQTATFTVAATGSGTLTYQWQKNSVNLSNGGNISGATTATLTITNCQSTDAASYRCVVTGECGSATSNGATLTVNSSGTTVILDEDQGTYSGAWSLSTGAGTAAYNGDYKWGNSAASETAWFRWTPNLTWAGNYDVYVMFRSGTNRPTNAAYTIYYNGGSQTYSVNQTINGGTWVLLGRKAFLTGTAGYVKLSNNTGGTGKAVIADAVKWVPVP